MPVFVQIAVNVPSQAGVFDYSLPDRLSGSVGVGHLVIVPFGKQTVQGVVLRFLDQPSVSFTKEVIDLVDPDPVLTQAQIVFAREMAESTLAPLASVLDLFLPPGLAQRADTLYELRGSVSTNPEVVTKELSKGSSIKSRITTVLKKRGRLRGRQIDRALPRLDWRRTAQYLIRRGVLTSLFVLPPASIRPKFIRTAQLAVSPEKAESAMRDLGKEGATQTRREKALRFLIKQPDAINVSWVYAESGCNLADLQELAERELIVLNETEIWRDPLQKIDRENSSPWNQPFHLTDEQQGAWAKIEAGFRQLAEGQRIKPFLLQGVTGSGKTEIYLRATEEAIQRGKQVIILVPEIALTPQIIRRFLARFPGQVGLVHSKLSEGERYDTWRRARAGLLKVIVGARSALFAPLPEIGLIVVDECHDGSYHQTEPPSYGAVSAAQSYATICRAVCILGSATPSVAQRYSSEIGNSLRLELTQRISSDSQRESGKELDLPRVQLIDLREELKAGNRGSFSRELTQALNSTLSRGEQAILFLNRRGTATYVFCHECGYVIKCPRCDTPLTYHTTSTELLLCHHCGYERKMPGKCPECGSTSIRAYGLGSEKVETEVQALFPKARTLRWDWETTRKKDSHDIILSHFASGRADVLIGTQMLAKGLDLPRVTLVGIVLADVGLHLPDPFSVERVFQVLTQVAGRAGRSSRGGRVVLQTFSPEHYAIQAASKHDVNGFYRQELAQRKRLGYPPFTRLVRLEFRHYDPAIAAKEAHSLAAKVEKWLAPDQRSQTLFIGPAPCFFSKLNGEYRWQIVLRDVDIAALLLDRSLAGWRIEVEPLNLL
jgi:primosomal protein N' (replication factor Y) (superfamily II helicase)